MLLTINIVIMPFRQQMGFFYYMLYCHERRSSCSQEEYLRRSFYCQVAQHDVNASDIIKPSHLVLQTANYPQTTHTHTHKNKNTCSTHNHSCPHKWCLSPFKMMLRAVTSPQRQDNALRFHGDSEKKRWKSETFIMALRGSVFAGDRKCVLWHLATSSWIISTFWEDTGFITTSVPTPFDMPHQAGLVSLPQAGCDKQPVQGRKK